MIKKRESVETTREILNSNLTKRALNGWETRRKKGTDVVARNKRMETLKKKGFSYSKSAKDGWKTRRKNGNDKPIPGFNGGWNKNLNKDTDQRMKKASDNIKLLFQNGRVPHNKGKKKFNYKPLKEAGKGISKQAKANGFFYHFLVKRKATSLEVILYSILDELNLKYDKQFKMVFETFRTAPDAYVPQYKLCLYADGESWHKSGIVKSIKGVEKKDKMQVKNLKKLGYNVLRFWGNDLQKNRNEVKKVIARFIDSY